MDILKSASRFVITCTTLFSQYRRGFPVCYNIAKSLGHPGADSTMVNVHIHMQLGKLDGMNYLECLVEIHGTTSGIDSDPSRLSQHPRSFTRSSRVAVETCLTVTPAYTGCHECKLNGLLAFPLHLYHYWVLVQTTQFCKIERKFF